ncbi:polysaccharide biosynthesis/export family protein [Solidesulfovibrio sp.]|jgi:polysaccharide export outer membrane protein|uniref:polysaccharide biosynthesis/export family protein n=1 Tax=Solidesulfovibrio sp. TaxID=2910990 RepID=UPI002B200FB2|nr:polysaccharide biosynthesis/export family protein [Solidesulfovibrio sp.]MEA5089856.1 polysaccharide biosynthesis/export family protein [Solidesulfovibrio sp.]
MPTARQFASSRGPRRALAFAACAAALLALLAACAKSSPPPLTPTSKNAAAGMATRRATLGYGDEVTVAVWRNDDLKTVARVDERGGINLPLVGDVKAGGRTVAELRADVARAYAKYVVDPQVTVTVATLRSQTALVLGEVKAQGVVSVDHDMNLFEAIARSGGFNDNAGRSTVVLLRPEGDRPRAYILDMRLGTSVGEGVVGFNRYLEGGDILFVPKSTWATVEEFMSHMTSALNAVINAERFVIFMPQLRDAVNDLFKGPTTTATVINNQSQPVAGEVLSNNQGGVFTVQ